MLARAVVSIGLEVNRPPSPEPSRLDDWFLGAGRGSQPRPAPVPFFPEVHEELTKSWMAPFTARSRSSASSILTTLDGGVAKGYVGIPQVERAIVVHLCPRNTATWRNRLRLPSKACKLTATLAAKAYSAAGKAASALHAMAILQVHQAKALEQVHKGSTNPGLMQELRSATDFALRATKVTARSLGKAMSTMVVQERHLWLNLAEMKEVDKAHFLDAPISQAGLFGDTVEGFAQQFSAVQQQTEAIQHILPWRDAPSTAAPGARPQSARRRGRPPASSRAALVGVRILNYLDDWLILAQSREQLGDHRDLVLRHLSQLGLRVNWEKSKLSPVQRISFLGVELDSVSMTARLTEEHAQAVLNCLSSFRGRNVVPLKLFQRLLGHMASAAAVTPLGLLHMRPLQHWLHSQVPRWAWRSCRLRVGITQQCRRSLSPWTDLAFLRAGVSLEQVSRHTVVTTDASSTGWGSTCNRQLWTGPRLLLHINCLELWAVHLALRQFRPLLLGKHVLVRTDNTAAVSYINRLGGIRSHHMSQVARHLLLWSHTQFKSLRAVHILGKLNHAADVLSRQITFPREWRLHPETIWLIWSRFGRSSGRPVCFPRVSLPSNGSGTSRRVFGPVYSHVVLRPRPGYVPKVPTTPFRDQVVNLQALPSEEADPALALLCPVRALRKYVDRTRSVRSSEQLFVCHRGEQKGKAVSKQRLAHWIVEAVTLAYQSQGEPCPLGVRAHSTRTVACSHALAHGDSLADICRAAGWVTPNTFTRFYNLRVEPVSSCVLCK